MIVNVFRYSPISMVARLGCEGARAVLGREAEYSSKVIYRRSGQTTYSTIIKTTVFFSPVDLQVVEWIQWEPVNPLDSMNTRGHNGALP